MNNIGPNGELHKLQVSSPKFRNGTPTPTFNANAPWWDSIGVSPSPSEGNVGKQMDPQLAQLIRAILSGSNTMRQTGNTTALIRSAGAQAGANAARGYANRNAQLGLDSSAAGVVDAQVRLPYMRQASEIDLATQAADWERKLMAQRTAGDMMARMDSLRLDYAKTLEDFNQRELDRQQQQTQWQQGFDAEAESRRLANEQRQLEIDAAKRAAAAAWQAEQDANNTRPGYITNSGPMILSSGPNARPNSVLMGGGYGGQYRMQAAGTRIGNKPAVLF